MHAFVKTTLVAASLAAALAVSAQPRTNIRPQALTPEQRTARFDDKVKQQAQDLQITAAQRPQWDAYVQAKKNMFAAKQQSRQDLQNQDPARMPADERAEMRARYLETAAQQARLLANSTKTLRNALTPEQRTRFDQMASRYGTRHDRHHRRGKPRGAQQRHGTLGNSQPPVSAASAAAR